MSAEPTEREWLEGRRYEDKFPALTGVVTERLILRQSAGEGSLGDTKIALSSTAGLGGFSLIVEVEPPNRKRVYVEYDLSPLVERIAQAVIDGGEMS